MTTERDKDVFEIADLGELPRLLTGLAQLWRAYHTSSPAIGRDAPSGVSGADLAVTGFSEMHLKLLLEKGLADFARPAGSRTRGSQDPSNQVALAADTYFFLTASGESLVSRILRASNTSADGSGSSSRRIDGGKQRALTPHWDRRRRELRVGDVLLKRFRTTARNQEVLLAAFEAAGWANGIDDPLPRANNRRAALRLDDTIRRLNRTLQQPLIQFEREPSSRRVTWRYRGVREHLLTNDNGRSLLIG